jgi:D-glycero-D-manno-heptose 1,7-bisphosphate phosphatase
MSPGVFLDRDGVLVRSPVIDGRSYAVCRLEDFRLLPGTVRAVGALREAGYKIVVVTNQPDIGNGLVDAATVEAMHRRLRERLAPDAIELCPHRQDENCLCRKPKPGMIHAAAKLLDIDLTASVVVGDRWGDIVAGKAAGCYTVFVDRGYAEQRPMMPDAIVRTLPVAVDVIMSRGRALGRNIDA